MFDHFEEFALKGLRGTNSVQTNSKVIDDVMMQNSSDFGKTP